MRQNLYISVIIDTIHTRNTHKHLKQLQKLQFLLNVRGLQKPREQSAPCSLTKPNQGSRQTKLFWEVGRRVL